MTKISAILTCTVLLVLAFSMPVLTGDFMHKRMSRIVADTNIRLDHWRETLQIMDSDLKASFLGMGLGSFPRTYANRSNASEKPATYWYKKEGNNGYLSLPSGGFLYLDQRIPLQPHNSYLLKLDIRSYDANARLAVPVCEKSLLYSFKCQWMVTKPGDTKGNWLHFEKKFDSGNVGDGAMFYQRRPVALSLLNERAGTVVDIDNIELWNVSGDNLVRNGHFSKNNDFWFFTSANHPPWHIKNLWVHLLFEQGWAGLILLNLLIFISLARLIKNVLSDDLLSLIILSSLGGLLTVGLVDSLLDFPRITFLFVLLVNIGLFRSGGPKFARN